MDQSSTPFGPKWNELEDTAASYLEDEESRRRPLSPVPMLERYRTESPEYEPPTAVAEPIPDGASRTVTLPFRQQSASKSTIQQSGSSVPGLQSEPQHLDGLVGAQGSFAVLSEPRAASKFSQSLQPPPSIVPSSTLHPPVNALNTTATNQRVYNRDSDGNLEQLVTVCWESYRDAPQTHMLHCGHVVVTAEAVACGTNCRTSMTAESKPKGKQIRCGPCAKLIMSNKQVRKRKTPHRAAKGPAAPENPDGQDGLFVDGPAPKRRKALPSEWSRSRAPSPEPIVKVEHPDDKALRELNAEMDADPALAKLANDMAPFTGRPMSKLHTGYALGEERDMNATIAKLPREVQNLRTEGTSILRYKLPRKQKAADDPFFAVHDRPIMQETKQDRRPHAYGKSGGEGKPSIRSKDAGMFSMSTDVYDRMVADEEGVIISSDAQDDLQHPREKDDFGDRDSDDDMEMDEARGVRADGTYFEEDRLCSCEMVTDEEVEQCTVCERWFHPSCLGVKKVTKCTDCKDERKGKQNLANSMFGGRAKASLAEIRERHAQSRDYKKQTTELYQTNHQIENRVQQRQTNALSDKAPSSNLKSKKLAADPMAIDRISGTPKSSGKKSSR